MKEKRFKIGNLFGKSQKRYEVNPNPKRNSNKSEVRIVKYESHPEDSKEVTSRDLCSPEARTDIVEDPYFNELMQEGLKQRETDSIYVRSEKPYEKKDSKSERIKFKPYKPIIQKDLTIVLVEETVSLNDYITLIEKIIRNLLKENYFCIVRYGSTVDCSEVKERYECLDELNFKSDFTNDRACLYDALKRVEQVVNEYYKKIIENSINRVEIGNIEIVGIGTCSDNASDLSPEEAIKLFDGILNKKVKTKYFCVDENSMINAALLGFRSIGSMSKKY